MIAIVDYGMGNLGSVEKALKFIGCESLITSDAKEIASASGVILPGVGSFAPAMEELNNRDLVTPLIDCAGSGKPFLGICLGMQLMLEGSEECSFDRRESNGVVSGLGIIPGFVRRFPDSGLKVPQMGWNRLFDVSGRLLTEGDYVYFVHSYFCQLGDASDTAAKTEYGINYCASFERGNIFGMQFHPEKSGEAGLRILSKFVAETKA
ncbi:MAG: imidazole glycerol phosphate synthase subunit HisH [Saccharofermentans sp.]|nr:imidazole glycerol phosphate synthase subunit HisH [Saccharofermentans sp.]